MIPEPTTELWLWLRTFWDTNIWPQTDEDAAQRMGDNWHQLSIALQSSVDEGNAANASAAAVWLDTDGGIFHDAVDENLNQGYAEAVASYEDVAKMCWDLARTVAQTKDQIYSELILNAVFFALTFLAPPGIGDLLRIRLLVSLANRFSSLIRAAAGLIEHAAASAPRALGRLIGEMAWEGVEEIGTEVLAQSMDMARGYRDKFDGTQIAIAWGAGTIGGPLGQGVSRIGRIGRRPAVPRPDLSRGSMVLRQTGQTFVVNGISSPISSVIAQSIAEGNYLNAINPLAWGEAVVSGGLTAGALGAGRIVSVHAGDVSGQFLNNHARSALGLKPLDPSALNPPGGGPNGPTPAAPDVSDVGTPGASTTAPGAAAAAGNQLGGSPGTGTVDAGPGVLAGARPSAGGAGHLTPTAGHGGGNTALADPPAPHVRQDASGHDQSGHNDNGTRQNSDQNNDGVHQEVGDGATDQGEAQAATDATAAQDVSGTDTHLDAGDSTAAPPSDAHSGSDHAAPRSETPGAADTNQAVDPGSHSTAGTDVQSVDQSGAPQQNVDQSGPLFVSQQPSGVMDGGSHNFARWGAHSRSGPSNHNSEVAVETEVAADLQTEVTTGPAHTSIETSEVAVADEGGVELAGSAETEVATSTDIVDAGTDTAVAETAEGVAENRGTALPADGSLQTSEPFSQAKAEPRPKMTMKETLREFAGGIGDAWGWTDHHAASAKGADGNAARLDDFVADGPVRDPQVVLPRILAILASPALRAFADVVRIGVPTVDSSPAGGLLVEVWTTTATDPVVLRFVVGPVADGHPAEFHLTEDGPTAAVITISEQIKDADIGRAVVHELRELSHLGEGRSAFSAHEQGRLGELLLMHDEAGRVVTDYAAQRAAYAAKMRAVAEDAGLGRSNEDQRLESLRDEDQVAVRRALAFAADPTVMPAPASEVAEESSFGWFNEDSPVVDQQDAAPTAEVTPWVPSGRPENPDEQGPNWVRWVVDKVTGFPRIAEARLSADFGNRSRPSADQQEREAGTARGQGQPGAGTDEGGHAVAWRFFQKVAAVMNYFPQAASFNRGAFLSMENEVGAWLKNGWQVDLKVFFPPNEPRPSSVTVVYVVSDPANPERGIWTAARTWENSAVPHRAELTGPGGTRRPMPAGRPKWAQKQTKAQYQRYQKKRIDAFDPERSNLFEPEADGPGAPPGPTTPGPVVPVVMGAGAAMAPDGSNQVKWSTEAPGGPSYLELEIVKLRTAEGTAPFEWVIGRPLDSLLPDGIEFSEAELGALEQQITALVAEGTEVEVRFSLVENEPRVTVMAAEANNGPVALEQLPIAEVIQALANHGVVVQGSRVVDGVLEVPALDPADPEFAHKATAEFIAKLNERAPDGQLTQDAAALRAAHYKTPNGLAAGEPTGIVQHRDNVKTFSVRTDSGTTTVALPGVKFVDGTFVADALVRSRPLGPPQLIPFSGLSGRGVSPQLLRGLQRILDLWMGGRGRPQELAETPWHELIEQILAEATPEELARLELSVDQQEVLDPDADRPISELGEELGEEFGQSILFHLREVFAGEEVQRVTLELGGANTFDQLYVRLEPGTGKILGWVVVEAKSVGGVIGSRLGRGQVRYEQGHGEYVLSIVQAMLNRQERVVVVDTFARETVEMGGRQREVPLRVKVDGDLSTGAAVAAEMLKALQEGKLQYFVVRAKIEATPEGAVPLGMAVTEYDMSLPSDPTVIGNAERLGDFAALGEVKDHEKLWARIVAELGFPKLAQFVDAQWIQIAPDGRSLLVKPWIGDPVVVELKVGAVPDGHPAEVRMRMGQRRAVVTISEQIEFADVGRALVHELREAGHAFGGRPSEGQPFSDHQQGRLGELLYLDYQRWLAEASGRTLESALYAARMRELLHDLGLQRAENDGRIDRLERQHDRIAVRRAAVAATESPTTPTPLNQPTVPTPVDQPTAPTPVDQPTVPTPADQPTVPIPVDQPTAPIPVDQPTVPIPVDQPTVPTPADQPTVPIPVDQPTVPIPVDQPTVPIPVDQSTVPIPVDQPTVPTPIDQPTVPIPIDQPTVPSPVDQPTVPAGDGQATVEFVRGEVKSLLFLDGARRFFAATDAVEYQAMLAMTDERVWQAAGILRVNWVGANRYEVHTAQGMFDVILTADQVAKGTAGTFVAFLNGGGPATLTVSNRAPDAIVERIVVNLLHQLSRAAEPTVPNVFEPGSEARRPGRLSREDGGRLAEARLLNGRMGETRVYEAVRRMSLRNAMRALLESMALATGQEDAEYRRASLPDWDAPMIEWHLQGWSKHDDRVRLREYLKREVTFSALALTLGAAAAAAIISGSLIAALGLALPAMAAASVNAFGQRWLDGEKKAVKGEASKLRLSEVRKRLPGMLHRIEADPHGVAGQPLGPIDQASLVPAGWRYVVKAAAPAVAAIGTVLLLSPFGAPIGGVIAAYSAMVVVKPIIERHLDLRKATTSIQRAVELEIRHALDPTSYRSQLLEALDELRARINGELAAAGSGRGNHRLPWLGLDELIGSELAEQLPLLSRRAADVHHGLQGADPTPLSEQLSAYAELLIFAAVSGVVGGLAAGAVEAAIQRLGDGVDAKVSEYHLKATSHQQTAELHAVFAEVLDQLSEVADLVERQRTGQALPNRLADRAVDRLRNRLSVPGGPAQGPPRGEMSAWWHSLHAVGPAVTVGVVGLVNSVLGIDLDIAAPALAFAGVQALALPAMKWWTEHQSARNREHERFAGNKEAVNRAELADQLTAMQYVLDRIGRDAGQVIGSAAPTVEIPLSGTELSALTDRVRAAVREARLAVVPKQEEPFRERQELHRLLDELERQADLVDEFGTAAESGQPGAPNRLAEAGRRLTELLAANAVHPDHRVRLPGPDTVDPANGRRLVGDPLTRAKGLAAEAWRRMVAEPEGIFNRSERVIALGRVRHALDTLEHQLAMIEADSHRRTLGVELALTDVAQTLEDFELLQREAGVAGTMGLDSVGIAQYVADRLLARNPDALAGADTRELPLAAPHQPTVELPTPPTVQLPMPPTVELPMPPTVELPVPTTVPIPVRPQTTAQRMAAEEYQARLRQARDRGRRNQGGAPGGG
ncbi:DNA/RNA non-specific endonuclease [Kribbella sp. NPDC051587]|uniref:WXG100-like domain-containing protein n=1 Tax=Kribbella sp. NPDC051587 TaxID=3364119 RepID=UPI0037BA2AB9